MTVEEAEALCSRFIEQGVAGVFFVPFEHQADREVANRRITERLRQAGIPVVLLDRDICAFPNRSAYDLIGVDNFAGGYLLAEHLIKLGARRLGYVMRPLTASTVDARIAGARIAMLAYGLEAPQPFVNSGDPDRPEVRPFFYSSSPNRCHSLHKRPPCRPAPANLDPPRHSRSPGPATRGLR
jgi:DNA-binding LacI/PurR family transcriptional regulator